MVPDHHAELMEIRTERDRLRDRQAIAEHLAPRV
jgi:hypothetical protein